MCGAIDRGILGVRGDPYDDCHLKLKSTSLPREQREKERGAICR